MRYLDPEYRIINLSYRYTRNPPVNDVNQDIDQGDISLIWPITDRWNFIARGNHDFTHRRELETFAGFEYNSCCYRVRLLARRWLDNELINTVDALDLEYDRGVFIEFQLKGLGGFGRKISKVLEESIVGFQQREESQNTRSRLSTRVDKTP